MGHKHSKVKSYVDEEEEKRKAEAAEEFQQCVDETMAMLVAMKEHFTDPISDSVIEEYESFEMKLYRLARLYSIAKERGYEDNPFDDRVTTLFCIGVRLKAIRYGFVAHLKDRLPQTTEYDHMLDEIQREVRVRALVAEHNRRIHLFDDFEKLYNRGDASQEELDKAYYDFAGEVCSYLRGYVCEYRSGSFGEAMAWDREETSIEEEFKKKFPNYNAPCILNHAEKNPICVTVVAVKKEETKETKETKETDETKE